jgi:3-deoxy-D-manno-octulosonic-acid transferase
MWRGRRHATRVRIASRLALRMTPCQERPVWLHAASVGEVRSLAVLVRELHRHGHGVLLTVATPAGFEQARAMYARSGCRIEPLPWDLPGATRRFMRAMRPRAGLFVETELWPNLVQAARRQRVPLGLVSARLSERSLRRYLRWAPHLMHATIDAFGGICAQGEADRERFVRLGAAAARVTVSASLKAAAQAPEELADHGRRLRERWAARRPAWVAGSTHAGEEALCIAAHGALLARARGRGAPLPLLVLAPRHPRRCDEVAAELAAAGIGYVRTSGAADSGQRDVEAVLVDEMGALPAWYAAADVAFVGGSLVPIGGHNLLEPALLGKPVLAGPHDANAPEVARRLRDAGGLQVVQDAGELAAAVDALFADPAAALHRGTCARNAATPDESGARAAMQLLSRLLEAGNAATGRAASRP